MKLINKETDEIGELRITKKHYAVVVGNGTASCRVEIYSSLAELNKEWEDYKEPKKWYTINKFNGSVQEINDNTCVWTDEEKESIKSLGLRFEAREEAEKAVEKLKAITRLKDKGFEFDGWEDLHAKMNLDDFIPFSRNVIDTDNVIGFRMDDYHDCIKDLNLLFSREDD